MHSFQAGFYPPLCLHSLDSTTVSQRSSGGGGLRCEGTLCIICPFVRSFLIISLVFSSVGLKTDPCIKFTHADLCIIPPERAATSHTPDRSLIASRTCVCRRERSLAAAACVWGPGRYSSWNTCCPGLLTLVNLRGRQEQTKKDCESSAGKED